MDRLIWCLICRGRDAGDGWARSFPLAPMPIKLDSIGGATSMTTPPAFILHRHASSGLSAAVRVRNVGEGRPGMELHQIRYFLALGETLNFTKAAEVCHITQPALTRAIRNMEEELGGLLFSRERNNTHLTELGRLIEPHLTEIMARAGEAKQTAARFIKLEKAQLSLGVMCTISPVAICQLPQSLQGRQSGRRHHTFGGRPQPTERPFGQRRA